MPARIRPPPHHRSLVGGGWHGTGARQPTAYDLAARCCPSWTCGKEDGCSQFDCRVHTSHHHQSLSLTLHPMGSMRGNKARGIPLRCLLLILSTHTVSILTAPFPQMRHGNGIKTADPGTRARPFALLHPPLHLGLRGGVNPEHLPRSFKRALRSHTKSRLQPARDRRMRKYAPL